MKISNKKHKDWKKNDKACTLLRRGRKEGTKKNDHL
jgi:hypothetical protein